MSTALDIITDALRELGVTGIGQTVSAEDAQVGLRKLNQLLQRWSNMRLFFPTLATISVPLDGSESYSIGPSGDVTALRPLTINGCTAIDAANIKSEVKVITREEWDAMTLTVVSGGIPEAVWYDAQNTNGVLYVYPQATNYTLTLECQVLLSGPVALTTVMDLPEGYESALSLTLADDLAATFGMQTSPDTRRRALGAVRAVKRTNFEPMGLSMCDESRSNILRGD